MLIVPNDLYLPGGFRTTGDKPFHHGANLARGTHDPGVKPGNLPSDEQEGKNCLEGGDGAFLFLIHDGLDFLR